MITEIKKPHPKVIKEGRNMNELEQDDYLLRMRSLEELAKKNKRKDRFLKWSIGIVSLIVALIPTWVFIVLYQVASPSNFIEKLAMIGVALFFAGGFQCFLLFLWVYFLLMLADCKLY